jgi:hypothetical protein
MSIVLLRTLTRKSIIGWGNFKDLSVQNLLDTFRHKELLHIYYTCRNIDFNQDLKDELCISGEREINKKEKQENRYNYPTDMYIGWCLKEMFSKKDEETLLREKRQLQKAIKHNKKRTAVREWAMAKTIYSKGALKGKNQGNSR